MKKDHEEQNVNLCFLQRCHSAAYCCSWQHRQPSERFLGMLQNYFQRPTIQNKCKILHEQIWEEALQHRFNKHWTHHLEWNIVSVCSFPQEGRSKNTMQIWFRQFKLNTWQGKRSSRLEPTNMKGEYVLCKILFQHSTNWC